MGGAVVYLAIAVALPLGLGYGIVVATRLVRRRAAQRPPSPPEPIERLGADLRRLHTQLDVTENAVGLPGKGVRTRAVRAAYLDALGEACARLDVPPPRARAGGGVPLTEIYRAEAALRGRGLDVRTRTA